METVIAKKEITTDMKKKLRDIQMAISWRDFANTYFQRSSSWFYHKMDGIDGNGGVGGFTEEEAEQLRGALFDLSRRIRVAAENIIYLRFGCIKEVFAPRKIVGHKENMGEITDCAVTSPEDKF